MKKPIIQGLLSLLLVLSLLLSAAPVNVIADGESLTAQPSTTKGAATITRVARSGNAPLFSDSAYMGGTGLTQKLKPTLAGLETAYSIETPQADTDAYVNPTHHRDATSMAHNSSAVLNATFIKQTDADYAANTNTTRAFKIEVKEKWYGAAETDPIPDVTKARLIAGERPAKDSQPDIWRNVLRNLPELNTGSANADLYAKLDELGFTGYFGPKEGLNLATDTFANSDNNVENYFTNPRYFFAAEEPGVYEITFAVVCATEGILATNTVEVSVLPRESRYKSRGNPLFPMWQYIPDTVPFVAEDPDKPGKDRLYWSGSHDVQFINNNSYCGTDQVMWSAPVDDLTDWTYHGVTSEVWYNRDNEKMSGTRVLYAPDMAMARDSDGKAWYYWYPFVNGGQPYVMKSDRPDGPFTGNIINWSSATNATGVIGTDPGVFWDPETNRVWQHQGIGTTTSSPLTVDELELDMYSRKAGTSRKNLPFTVDDDEGDTDPSGRTRYYEAPKMSKIWFDKNTGESLAYGAHDPSNPNHVAKYVLVYARRATTAEGRAWAANQKAYTWADSPDGPFTYGGVLIDAGGEVLENATTAFAHHNTHGAMFQVKDKWYVSYHRTTGRGFNARQSVVEELEYVRLNTKTGAVEIPEAEMTSMGFNTQGLNPYEFYSAGFACYYTPENWLGNPMNAINGSHMHWDASILPDRSGPSRSATGNNANVPVPEVGSWDDNMSIVNLMDGNAVGFKYLNFNGAADVKEGHHSVVDIYVTPSGRTPRTGAGFNGVDYSNAPSSVVGYIDVYLEAEKTPFRPNETSSSRQIIGTAAITADMPLNQITKLTVPVPAIDTLTGKRALFFVFRSPQDTRICEFRGFEFRQVTNPALASDSVDLDIVLNTAGPFDRFALMSGETADLIINAVHASGTKTAVTSAATVTITGGTYSSGKLTAGEPGTGSITASYGSLTKTVPFKVTEFQPRAGMITVNGKPIPNFNRDKFSYSFTAAELNLIANPVIAVTPASSRLTATITQVNALTGTASVTVSETANPDSFVEYKIHFRDAPVNDYLADGTYSSDWKAFHEATDDNTWRIEKGRGLVLPTRTVGIFQTGTGNGSRTAETSTIDFKNMLTIPAAGDWRIFAKIRLPETTAANQYEIGVYAWEDQNNFVVNRALTQGTTGGSVNLRKGVAVNGTFKPNKNGASLTLTNRVLYLGLEKSGDFYTALHSTNGISFPGSDGRFGPYTSASNNEPQFASGSVVRDVHFGIMASQDTAARTVREFEVEYIVIQSKDGTRILNNRDTRQYGVDNVSDYLAADLQGTPPVTANLTLPAAPTGYTRTIVSDNPSILSNEGVLGFPAPAAGQPSTNVPVTLSVTVTDGTGENQVSASEDAIVQVPMTDAAIEALSDTELMTATKTAINAKNFTAPQVYCATKDAARAYVQNLVNDLALGGVVATVVDGDFSPASAGDENTPSGVNGSYTFTVNLSKGSVNDVISQKTLTIVATPLPEILSVTADTAANSVTALLNGVLADGRVIATAYDASGRMLSVGTASAPGEEYSIPLNLSGASKVKVFVWGGLGDLVPQCLAKEISIAK